MRQIFVVALNDLRLMFMNRSIWINLAIVPMIVTFATGSAFSGIGSDGGINAVNLDVIDYDETPLSAELLRQISAATEAVRVCPADTGDDACDLDRQPLTVELAQQRLDDNISAAYIEIPAGFAAATNAGDPTEIVYRSNESLAEPSFVLQSVQTAITRISSTTAAVRIGESMADEMSYLRFTDDADRAAFRDSIRSHAQARWAANPIQVQATQPASAGAPVTASGFRQSVPGMGSMYVLFAVLPMSAAFLRDRKQWTLQRALTMPVSRAQMMSGKLLAYFVIGLIQLSIIFTFGYFLGVRYGSDPLAIVATMLTFILAVTALALMLTTFMKTEAQASSANLLVSLTLASLGGAWWPLDIVPEWMRVVGYVSPIAWAMDAYNALLFRDAGFSGVIVPLAVLLGMGTIFFVIGVQRLKFD
jgi:ABC-2 type transport system permease protein